HLSDAQPRRWRGRRPEDHETSDEEPQTRRTPSHFHDSPPDDDVWNRANGALLTVKTTMRPARSRFEPPRRPAFAEATAGHPSLARRWPWYRSSRHGVAHGCVTAGR